MTGPGSTVGPDLAHRRTASSIRITDPTGRPLPGSRVRVRQTAHAFGFGNIAFDLVEWKGGAPSAEDHRVIEFFGGTLVPEPQALADDWLELFNLAILPFYWRGFEPQQGRRDTDRLLRTAQWLQEQGVQVKGHPLVWHTLTPHWLLDLDDAGVEAAIRDRIQQLVTDFTGTIDLWDAINEAVILPVFTAENNAVTRLAQSKDRLGMVKMAFEAAREANPTARLVINDFDLSESYEQLLEECLDAGVQIDAIGLQTHMHKGYRGEEQIWNVLERFSRFDLPLQLTETTLLSGELMPSHIGDLNDYIVEDWPSTPEGEERQADELVRHVRNVVAHPATESLTYWGITDRGSWLGAPSGLLRADGSRKPSFDALHALLTQEWWHQEEELVADDAGMIQVDGIAGDYRIEGVRGTDGPAGAEDAASIRLEAGAHQLDAALLPASADGDRS
ncbi:endo-1,4-beta-xylanase [Brachybacterium tyrofermentans]|uniref:endo-1,4-beta-xylanase n=1 Tax=Brachybacterium tyrofermentans TaxID=47848 RepID=UPI003FCF3D31